MYRAVTLACIREGIANEAGIDLDRLPKLLDNIEVGFTRIPRARAGSPP